MLMAGHDDTLSIVNTIPCTVIFVFCVVLS